MTNHESVEDEPDEGRAPRFTPAHLLAVVRRGDRTERLEVAGETNMPAEGVALLARDPDPGIREALLTNGAVPLVALEEMLERFPEARAQIANHPNAPMKLMESAPLVSHTSLSLDSFLRRRAASQGQRDALLAAHSRAQEHQLTVTLGDAWAQVKQATEARPLA